MTEIEVLRLAYNWRRYGYGLTPFGEMLADRYEQLLRSFPHG